LHFLLLASCMCSSAGRVDVFCKPRDIIVCNMGITALNAVFVFDRSLCILSCVIWVLHGDNIPIMQCI
jgi:hypothetical protein